jgi:hypothetical protein
MTTREKLILAGAAVCLLAVIAFAALYASEKIAGASAKATVEAKQQVIEAAQKSMEARERAWREDLERWEREKEAIKSLPQAVKVIERYVPQAAPAVQVSREQLSASDRAKLPESPGYTVRTEAQEVALGTEIVQCQQDRAAFSKCAGDKADLETQLRAAREQKEALEKALKGGTKWQRAKKAVKVSGCAGLGAAPGALGKDARAAVVGAAAGAMLCSIF